MTATDNQASAPEAQNASVTDPSYWIALFMVSSVVVTLLWEGALLAGALFIVEVALYSASVMRRKNADLLRTITEREAAFQSLNNRLHEAGRRHAEKASELNGQIADQATAAALREQAHTATVQRLSAEKQRERGAHDRALARQAQEFRAEVDGYLARLQAESVANDDSILLSDVSVPGTQASDRKHTHFLVIAFPTHAEAGQIPVRFPGVGEDPYTIVCGKRDFKLTITRVGDRYRVNIVIVARTVTKHYGFETVRPDGAAFVFADYVVGVFRENRLTAYKDAVIALFLVSRMYWKPLMDFFTSLRYATSESGPAREDTMVEGAPQDPELRAAVREQLERMK